MEIKAESIPQIEQKKQKVFDFAVAWNWEYDRDFIYQINDACLKLGLKPYIVNPHNLSETLQLLKEGQIKFLSFFDRASDTDSRFLELAQVLQENGVFIVNHPDKIKWIDDKALIHMDCVTNEISVPQTFIYYPTDERRVIMNKIKHIGAPFVIKPAHGVESGGMGVMLNAHTAEDVQQWHSRYKNYIFLLQKQITPCLIDKKVASFRVFYVFGKILPCWWDPVTHIYEVVTEEERKKSGLEPLYDITKKIWKIYSLGFFSTEIYMEKSRRFVVIDYINDQCDMRRKTKFIDAVCDTVIDAVALEIARKVKKIVRKNAISLFN